MFSKTLIATTLAAAATASEVTFPTVESVKFLQGPVGVNVCMTCIEFANDGIQDLANFIGNNGIPEACGDLCSVIPSTFFAGACDSLCTQVGIDVFVETLKNADLDPFFLCEELKVCTAGPANAAAKVFKVFAKPATGKSGISVGLIMDLVVTNSTGLGEIEFSLTAGGKTQSQNIPVAGFPKGAHGIELNLSTKGAPAGVYDFNMGFCQGECFSHHLTSKYFGNASSSFTLTAADIEA